MPKRRSRFEETMLMSNVTYETAQTQFVKAGDVRHHASHAHEQFHRRLGGAPGATGVDRGRTLASPVRGPGAAGVAAAGQHLPRARDRAYQARRAQMADRLREREC